MHDRQLYLNCRVSRRAIPPCRWPKSSSAFRPPADYTATALAYLTVEKAAFEYDDLIHLVTVTYEPRYFFVRKDSPYKDMNDLVEDIRKRPGKVTIAIPQGSGAHWQLEYIKKVMDLNARTVGYKG